MSIKFTHIMTESPTRVGKEFSIGDDDTIQKKSGAQITSATAHTVELEDITAVTNYLSKLTTSDALTFGITADPDVRIVTKNRLARLQEAGITKDSDGLPYVARTNTYFSFHDSAGIMMLDYDPAKDGSVILTKDEFLSDLYKVFPGLKNTPHIWSPSSSSCIYNADTGEEVYGVRGQRLYIHVDNACDIPRAGKALFERLWLNGYGHIELSLSGSILKRAIIDAAVWQPERLDFAGGAHCTYPLEQRKPQLEIFNA